MLRRATLRIKGMNDSRVAFCIKIEEEEAYDDKWN